MNSLIQNKPNLLQHGFTLIELVISMFLTTLLLATLSAGMYSVVNDWQRETSGLDIALDKSLGLLQIEKSLMSAFPHSYKDQQTLSRYIYFVGTDDTLSWVSTVSPQRKAELTTWLLASDENEGVILSLTPAYSDNPEERLDQVNPIVLMAGYEATFRYLYQENEQEKEWVDEWYGDEMQSLPMAVHITFMPIDDETNIFEIVAPIKNYQHEDIQPAILGF